MASRSLRLRVRQAYAAFESRAGDVRAPRGAKTELVLAAVREFSGPFTIGMLEQQCRRVGRDLIRRVLRDLKAMGLVSAERRGSGARWMKRVRFQ